MLILSRLEHLLIHPTTSQDEKECNNCVALEFFKRHGHGSVAWQVRRHINAATRDPLFTSNKNAVY